MDLDKLVITDEMIDYVMAKYGNKWQVGDAIVDVIVDDLLQKEFNKQERVKDDKGKAILKEVVIIDSDPSSNDTPPSTYPFQTSSHDTHTSTKTLETSSDDTYLTTHPFHTSSDLNLKWYEDSSFGDQRIVLKVNQGQALKIFKVKKLQDSNFQKLNRSSSKSLPIKKPPNSKHLTPKTGSSSKPYYAKLTSRSKDLQADVGASARSFTLLVPTKKPFPIMNCILGLSAERIRGLILNKEFGIRKPKEYVGASTYVTRKGKRKMV
ncbi:hypothetical protein Tco_0597810 [Tanacetum coccineum]